MNLTSKLTISATVLGATLLYLFLGSSEIDALTPLDPEKLVKTPALASPEQPTSPTFDPNQFHFSRDNILGTSFEFTVVAEDEQTAAAVEVRVLQEIAEGEKLMSTYDPQSEISLINARPFVSGQRIPISESLFLLLRECLLISNKSDFAFNAYLGEAIDLWDRSEKQGKRPSSDLAAQAVSAVRPGFKVVLVKQGKKPNIVRKRYLVRLAPGKFQFDGIGKGYLIDNAVREVVKDVPEIRGLRLNIGGEISVWGESSLTSKRPWRIAIADPSRPEDNAPPLTRLALRNLSVATSGNYARYRQIEGKRVGHILDPATGLATQRIRGATVVAGSAQRADALATALCVLSPEEGIKAVESVSDAACLIVDQAGKIHRSRIFPALETQERASGQDSWSDKFALRVQFELVRSEQEAKFHRHYFAAWIEDEVGRRIRILALWTKRDEIDYARDLNTFWRSAWVLAGEGSSPLPLREYSRATRAPGRYSLIWDGRDDSGALVPQGKYTIHLDVNREKGPPSEREHHTHVSVEMDCRDQASVQTADPQPELRGVRVEYEPVDESGSK